MKGKGFLGKCAVFAMLTASLMISNVAFAEEKTGGADGTEITDVSGNSPAETPTQLVKLDTPTIRWGAQDGTKLHEEFTITTVPHCENVYRIKLEKDGDESYTTKWHFGTDNKKEFTGSIGDNINQPGTYRLSVQAVGNDKTGYTDSDWSAYSDEWTYNEVEKLATPDAPTWEDGNLGGCKFSLPENAGGWKLTLYKDGYSWGGVQSYYPEECKENFLNDMTQPGIYTVTLEALSGDLTKYGNSDKSSPSAGLDLKSMNQKVETKLDNTSTEMNAAKSADEAKAALNNLTSNTSVSELQAAMQSDDSALSNIGNIENAYCTKMNIFVSENVAQDLGDVLPDAADKISVVGAALNATDQNAALFLNITKPSDDINVNEAVFHNIVKVDISLTGVTGDLKVPVSITMPIPKGVLVDRMRILHYLNGSTTDYETIIPKVNGDGTVTFVLTRFSDFAFVNVDDDTAVSMTGTNVSTGTDSGSSEKSESVTNVWKPVTAADIKRFGYVSAIIPEYTVSRKGTSIYNAVQGENCIALMEQAAKGYTLIRTYNIFADANRGSKTTRATGTPVTLKIKLDKSLQKKGRTFEMVGVSANGITNIYPDLDQDDSTITIACQNFYAFALAYKDKKVK